MSAPVRRALALSPALAALLAAGCFSTSIRVVQAVPTDRPRDRVYVIVYEGGAPASFGYRMSRATLDALGAHTGARAGRVLTGIEFDTAFVDQEIDRFGAQVVLTIKPLGTRTGRYAEIVGLTYGATLTERPSNQPLWAAKIEISGAMWDEAVPAAAGKLVDALANDHLIPPASPPAETATPLPAPLPQTGDGAFR